MEEKYFNKKINDLSDTVSLMNSSDYRERFKAEYYQTKIRYEKLKHFCNRIEASMISEVVDEPRHDCSLDMLREQQKIMGKYLHMLELRAVIEKIEL